jgi:L-alanine-DL-glutamate epimerase-like enolase superfamily enzyme
VVDRVAARAPDDGPTIEAVEVSAFTVPTDGPESDGTLEWSQTTAIVVELTAGGVRGLGYSYGDAAGARLIAGTLAEPLLDRDPLAPQALHDALVARCRNLGWPGLASIAISACDAACWDLKARLLGRPLVDLLGPAREAVPVYGSGGFCSYSLERLQAQLGGWAARGIRRVKMKVGREPWADPRRVAAAREAIGPRVALMVDANGAYSRKQALALARPFVDLGVVWFEEPVSSDDLDGLRFVRERVPPPIEVTAGEYGWDPWYFRRMLEAQAVDVLQVDATRCGVTGFLRAAALVRGFGVPLSAHTAPTLHAHLCAAEDVARDIEYFHDHVRVEALLFDGALEAKDGVIRPDRRRPGLGLELRRGDAGRFLKVHEVRRSTRAAAAPRRAGAGRQA